MLFRSNQNYKFDPKIVKLSDFGFARYYDIQANDLAQTFCGTPLYMSPELYESRFKHSSYNCSVDIWSFGVILYKLIYDAYPFYIERLDLGGEFSSFSIPRWRIISNECLDLLKLIFKKKPQDRTTSEKIGKHLFFQKLETKTYGEEIDGSFTELIIKTF